MGDHPAIHVRREVDATNNKMDFTTPVDGALVATIPSAWYEDHWAYCAAVQAAMRAAPGLGGGYAAAILVEPIFPGDGYGTQYHGNTRVYFGGGGGSLEWNTGPNTAVSCGADLGFDTSADDGNAVYHVSDWQAPNWWLSLWAEGVGSVPDSPEVVGGKKRVSLSGAHHVQVVVGVDRTQRVLRIVMQPGEYTYAEYATGANANRDFETVWKQLRGDADLSYFRLYPDEESDSGYTTYSVMEPSRWVAQIERTTKGIKRYSWTLELARKES